MKKMIRIVHVTFLKLFVKILKTGIFENLIIFDFNPHENST